MHGPRPVALHTGLSAVDRFAERNVAGHLLRIQRDLRRRHRLSMVKDLPPQQTLPRREAMFRRGGWNQRTAGGT